jgi:hypothetical protein
VLRDRLVCQNGGDIFAIYQQQSRPAAEGPLRPLAGLARDINTDSGKEAVLF